MTVDPTTPDVARTEQVAALDSALDSALDGRMLLTHPFYLRWQAGELTVDDLADYAVQYRAFEAELPATLGRVVDGLRGTGADGAAEVAAGNLADEEGSPAPHLVLFDRFAASLPPARLPEPGPAATALAATYRELAAEGPVHALAALAAYERQAPAIASTKADGLRRWYGIGPAGTEFWDVHADMDRDHARWAVEALAMAGADPGEVREAARRGADAWWALLDERLEAASAS